MEDVESQSASCGFEKIGEGLKGELDVPKARVELQKGLLKALRELQKLVDLWRVGYRQADEERDAHAQQTLVQELACGATL